LLFAVARMARIGLLSVVFLPYLAILIIWRSARVPRVLRRYLEISGGGFVKAGQLLAMRFDLLPAAYCSELSGLLGGLTPVPTDDIVTVIIRELGAERFRTRFASFDRTAVSTASIAQVHRARLDTGETVAVKVVKPGVARTMRVDMSLAVAIGTIVSLVPSAAFRGVRATLREIREASLAELDLSREAQFTRFMREAMLRDAVPHSAPRVYSDISTPSVLVLEYIEGLRIDMLLEAIEERDEAFLSELKRLDISPETAAELLLRSILTQTLVHRHFNADPHAANLILQPGGRIVWVDFGLTGWIDERQWRYEVLTREAFLQGRVDRNVQLIIQSLRPSRSADLRRFERMLRVTIHDYMMASADRDADPRDRSFLGFFFTFVQNLRRSGIKAEASLMQFYRTVLIGDVLMHKLDPNIDWTQVVRDFMRVELAPRILAEAVEPWISVGFLLAQAPYALLDRAVREGESSESAINAISVLAQTGRRLLSWTHTVAFAALGLSFLVLLGRFFVAYAWLPSVETTLISSLAAATVMVCAGVARSRS
jgi:ubiquinone biosynthesis protein